MIQADEIAGEGSNRCQLIEQAVVEFIDRRRRRTREARDLEILNQNAEPLNEEIEDVLSYQASL